MRTLVDIPEEELSQLKALSKARRVSRAHLVRSAIGEYLQAQTKDSLDAAFGMWADRNIDALEYQEQMRREWERES